MGRDECEDLLRDMRSGGDVCLGIYAVPSGSSQHTDVDVCWKGPHVTLAGFHNYGGRAPAGSDLKSSLDALAAVKSGGKTWHVTSHNSHMRPHHLALHSRTLQEVAHGLKNAGFHNIKPSPQQETGLHVTLDRDRCPRGSTCEKEALKSFATSPWHLYPVALNHCSRLPRNACPLEENLHYCHSMVSRPITS